MIELASLFSIYCSKEFSSLHRGHLTLFCLVINYVKHSFPKVCYLLASIIGSLRI